MPGRLEANQAVTTGRKNNRAGAGRLRLSCVRQVGNLGLFIRARSDQAAPEPTSGALADPLLVKIDNRPVYQEAIIPVLLLLLTGLIPLFNLLALGNGFTVKPGVNPSAVAFNLLMLVIFYGLLISLMPTLFMGFTDFATISERWLLICSREIFFIESRHYRIFMTFNQQQRLKGFRRDNIKRLAFHYHHGTTTIGRGCMNPRVLPHLLIWNLLLFDASQPERQDPGADPAFNVDPIYLDDLAYESATELHAILARWLPKDTELLPLPPPEETAGGPEAK